MACHMLSVYITLNIDRGGDLEDKWEALLHCSFFKGQFAKSIALQELPKVRHSNLLLQKTKCNGKINGYKAHYH
jgi:hypothetical protein